MLHKHATRSDEQYNDKDNLNVIFTKSKAGGIVSIVNCILYIIALLTNDWIIGGYDNKVMHSGLNYAHVNGNIVDITALCNYREWACKLVYAGYWCNGFMWSGLILYILANVHVYISEQHSHIYVNHGISKDIQNKCIYGIWLISMIFNFLGLVLYTNISPSHFDYEMIQFEASYGLAVMCTFVTFTQMSLIFLIMLKKIDNNMIIEALDEYTHSTGIKRALYILFMIQILCAYPFLLEGFDWSPIISFFGLYWVDTQRNNIYSIYCSLTSVSFLVDILKISMMREYKYDTIGQAWIDTIYIIYAIMKFVSFILSLFYSQILMKIEDDNRTNISVHSQESDQENGEEWSNGHFIVE